MRRIGALAAALGVAGVAGPVLDPDRQGHLGHGRRQVAADIGGQRLERRDVEGVQTGMAVRALDQRRQEPGQRLAAPGGRDQEERGQSGTVEHVLLMRVDLPAALVEPVRKRGGRAVIGAA